MFPNALVQRVYKCFVNPPVPAKKDGAVRIGLLGASSIAPIAVIAPAKSHPDAIIAAVAARDPKRAEEYAKKHDIPIVHTSYQDLIDDPSIDAIYIALPNGLHYEWAIRCLRAGKHVLLEKPATSNAEEAKKLFLHPPFTTENAPVLLEAFHYQFHPAWQTFLAEVRRAGTVKHVNAAQYVPSGVMKHDDIRFQYSISGGCLMDLGTYALSTVRQVMDRETIKAVEATHTPLPMKPDGTPGDPLVDRAMKASIISESGITADIESDLSSSFEWPGFFPKPLRLTLPSLGMPMCRAILKEVVENIQPDNTEHAVQKTVTMWNFMMPVVWHRIDIMEQHKILKEGKLIKQWKETRYVKGYTWSDDDERAGSYPDHWTTWRCQMEEFINRIKGRKGSGVWIDASETIKQMEGIDDIYQKSGLKPRPSSAFDG